jgi:hypothetical protein
MNFNRHLFTLEEIARMERMVERVENLRRRGVSKDPFFDLKLDAMEDDPNTSSLDMLTAMEAELSRLESLLN